MSEPTHKVEITNSDAVGGGCAWFPIFIALLFIVSKLDRIADALEKLVSK